ncbi:MAG: protein kinase [Candidatus Obscuribacterales bacterium]|nr:protein kinase [Candidatus Obscuribacterales bacterium]
MAVLSQPSQTLASRCGMFDIGTVIDDRYELTAHIGDGGMGSVFKARDAALERFVAIKIIRPELLSDSESQARFQREWQMLSHLVHPNIVALYRFGVWQNKWSYFAMEYLEGDSLREKIDRSGALPIDPFFKIAEQICLALQAAHNAGIVHRDIKPGNVMMTNHPRPNTVKLVDFGVAGFSDHSAATQRLTQTGELVGSLHYMSPEQCKGAAADARSDIYSTGCLFYELLSGKIPLQADNPIALMHKHLEEYPDEVTGKQTQLPEGLNNVLFKAIAKDPQDRYQSMDELRHDLALVAKGAGNYVSAPQRSRLRRRSSVAPPALLAGGIVAIVGAAIVFARFNEHRTQNIVVETSADARIAKLKQEIARFENRVKLARTAHEKERAIAILYTSQGELVDFLMANGPRLDEAESIVKSRLETAKKINDQGLSEARILNHWATIYNVRARIERDSKNRDANSLKALELLERSKRALHGRIDVAILEAQSVTMAQLGRMKESSRLFNEALTAMKSLRRDPSNNRKDFRYYAHQLNLCARPKTKEDRLVLCDINLRIYEHQIENTMWESGAIMTRVGVPRPLKLDSVTVAKKWLMQAYREPPTDSDNLVLYRQRKNLIDKYEAEFRHATPGS